MKEKLIEFCNTLQIEYVGVAGPGPYKDFGEIWKRQIERGYITGFEEKDFDRRIDSRLSLPQAKSVIVCLFPYYVGTAEGSNLSKYAYLVDYHIIIKRKLTAIGEYLKENIKGFQYKAYVDAGPLDERYLAYKAGLGFRGLNGHIINEKYGSYVFIGYIINNYPFMPDEPDERTCNKCGKCIESCPGQCISGNFTINPLKCKSYITQKKGELNDEETKILKKHNLIWGCDVCQDVCPHNENIEETPIEEFNTNLIYNLDCREMSQISHREFDKKYRNRSFAWRGKKILKRNCEILEKD
ncbi:MAG: tRNA epoxyqueuosine(34) reductase QueG [Clostridiales bacterium]|nr:tRNA epoxyqueuosine(34) reductase QueG [Clostridiales bacterium]